jgi:hypothetical protein
VCVDIVQVATPLSGYAALCVDVVFVCGWCAAVSPFAIHLALHVCVCVCVCVCMSVSVCVCVCVCVCV